MSDGAGPFLTVLWGRARRVRRLEPLPPAVARNGDMAHRASTWLRSGVDTQSIIDGLVRVAQFGTVERCAARMAWPWDALPDLDGITWDWPRRSA